MVHHEYAAGTLPLGIPERTDVDAAGATMDRMRPRVSCAIGDLLGGDGLNQFGLSRIGFGIDDVDVRGTQPRSDEVTPLYVRVRRIWTQMRAAGVPTEVVQLVTHTGNSNVADDL